MWEREAVPLAHAKPIMEYLSVFSFPRFVTFEEPFFLLAIPLIGVLYLVFILFFYRRKLFKRRVPQELAVWVRPNWGRLRSMLHAGGAATWIIASLVGLSTPLLFLSAGQLPLQNVGFIVALDCSWSMASEEDIFGVGGRFGAAKREIVEEFTLLAGERTRPRLGVVCFAGITMRSFVLYDSYERFLEQVSNAVVLPENVQGTNYEAAFQDILSMCERAPDLIYCGAAVITDGDREDATKQPRLFTDILPRFREKNVRLDVIGVGKNEAPLPPLSGWGSPLDPDALERGEIAPVKTKYDRDFLDEIAKAGGGEFYSYGERGALRKHLASIRATMEERVRHQTRRWTDVSEYCYLISYLGMFIFLVTHIPFHKIKFFVRKKKK